RPCRRTRPRLTGGPVVSQKRKDPPSAGTTAASVPVGQEPDGGPARPPESRYALLWRLLGGGIAPLVFVAGATVYQQMESQVSELRGELGMLSKDLRKELGRLSTSHGEMIKKDDHTTRMRATWDALKELRTDRSDLSVLRERCSVLLEMIKAGDAERARL